MPPARIKCSQVIDPPHKCGEIATVDEVQPGVYRSTCTPAPGGRPHVQLFGDAYLAIAEVVQ